MPAPVTRSNWPSCVTVGSVHSRRSNPICSSIRAPRLVNVLPSASYSTAFRPTPTPSRNLPFVRRSTRCLFGDERRLALREDDDSGHGLERGDGGKVAEQHERFV